MKAILFVVLLSVIGLGYSELSCPKVFDGLTNGHFDLATQFSVSEISANWVGLSSNQILGYDWAIVSDAKVNKAPDTSCKLVQPFVGAPDVRNWANVKKDSSATASGLKLSAKTTYFVVLRTTLSDGSHVFSMSNGIFILPQELNLEGSHKRVETQKESEKEATRNLEQVSLECPIDQDNRCRKSQISVRDILSELYGPPRFLFEPVFVAAIPADGDDDDDDDDDGGTGAILGIIVGAVIGGVALLCVCCLLLLLLGLLFMRGGGEDKFTENVVTRQNENVDADFGTTTQHELADDVRVEFPDYGDPSTRLSTA